MAETGDWEWRSLLLSGETRDNKEMTAVCREAREKVVKIVPVASSSIRGS